MMFYVFLMILQAQGGVAVVHGDAGECEAARLEMVGKPEVIAISKACVASDLLKQGPTSKT